MDPRSQSDSDGGRGRHGWSPPVAGSPDAPRDEGAPPPPPQPPQAHNEPPDPGLTNGQPPHIPIVLSLDQITITWSSNEYTDGPTLAQRSPASQQRPQKSDVVTPPGSRTSVQQETREEMPNNLRNLHSLTQYGNTSTSISPREGELRPSSVENSQSSRTSVGSTSSGQRLPNSPPGSSQIIRTQPARAELRSEELKPLSESRAVVAVPGSMKSRRIHSDKCEDCGLCCCPECRRPRVLPSCWTCGRRCMCSLQSAVEYGTCVCCVRGLFYHCSSDDEDTCTDKPFSCTQAHCCVRWAAASLLSLLFPCLLCYLPAKGCVAACQCCYDRATRPGCRCKSPNPIHCEDAGKPT